MTTVDDYDWNARFGVGIDLGTTYSCVSVYKDGRITVIADENGNKLIPSVVSFTNKRGAIRRLVGHDALENYDTHPKNIVTEVKRLIGRIFDEETVQTNKKRWSFKVTANKFGDAQVNLDFNESPKSRTVNELVRESRKIMIIDVGGGTSDVALIEIAGKNFTVLSSEGDNNIGGEDFDTNLVNYCLEQIKLNSNVKIDEEKDLKRLRNKCEQTKRKLSENTADPNWQYVLELDDLDCGIDVTLPISRRKFEEINQDLFNNAIALIPACLRKVNMCISDVDDIITVGGSMRIPKLREMVQTMFEDTQLYSYINPDEAISVGAAILAAQSIGIYSEHLMLSDVTPFSLGIRTRLTIDAPAEEDRMYVIVPRNTKIPCERQKGFETLEDNQKTLAVDVYQGENEFVKDNMLLGNFKIEGLKKALAGETKIVVTLKVDANGILKVTAKEVATEKENVVTGDLDSLLPHLSMLSVTRVKGDNNVGGEDFDSNLVTHCLEQVYEKYDVTLKNNGLAMRRLRSKCEEIKRKLSENPADPDCSSDLELDDLVNDTDISLTISRTKFEEINQYLFDRVTELVSACLTDAKLSISDIYHIIPVGGSMKIPRLREMLQELFQGKFLHSYINPDEAVAVGASILAAQKLGIFCGRKLMLSDVTPFSLGIKVNSRSGEEEMRVIIPRNTKIPCEEDDYDWNLEIDSAVGIDLGTTYSCVAVYKDSRITVIRDEDGNKLIPSVVAFESDGEGIKRLVGREATENEQIDQSQVVTVTADSKGDAQVNMNRDGHPTLHLSPEDISSSIVSKLKQMAEKHLGKKEVTHAVITVPAHFNNSQREATMKAAELAKLKVLAIINEPNAGALAYGIRSKVKQKRNILVMDVGGGTSDVALIKVVEENFEVLACKGDNNLGGEDFDTNLVNYCVELIKQKFGSDVTIGKLQMRRLRNKCEQAKRNLSKNTDDPNWQYVLELDDFIDNKPHDITLPISRTKFEELNQYLFDRALGLVSSCLNEAKLSISDVNDLVPVGGSMRIPKLREMLQKLFQGKQLYAYINPDEAIAVGAAIFAAQKLTLYRGHIVLSDITPFSLGKKSSETKDKKIIKAAIMSVIIPRNAKIPCKGQRRYNTINDNQTDMAINIYQGENEYVKDNMFLGGFEIENLTPAPAGETKVDVTLEVDTNGILKVTAKEVSTEKENVVTRDMNALVPHLNLLNVGQSE
ncbi:hypothetical protein B566_EDAN013976 [Ephemera danica]|nr:hypothetical protein B566_EDAN013976 [Ephemera danica]